MKNNGITVNVASDQTLSDVDMATMFSTRPLPQGVVTVLAMSSTGVELAQAKAKQTPSDTSFSGFQRVAGIRAPYIFVNEFQHSSNTGIMVHEMMHGLRGDWWAQDAGSLSRELRLRAPWLYEYLIHMGEHPVN